MAALKATNARARLSLSRAADYVRLCAMAPFISVDKHLGLRSTTIAIRGFTRVTIRGLEVQHFTNEHAHAVVCTEGLRVITLGYARDLALIIDEPGLDTDKAIEMASFVIETAACVALLRAARKHGVDDVGNGFDELPILPVFDAHGVFAPSTDEYVCMVQGIFDFPEVLTRFTWRFKPPQSDKDECLADYACSLAATVANGP